MVISPKIPRIACVVAFVLAAGVSIGALMGPIIDSSLDSRYWGFVSSGDLIGSPP
jgi:hypothetical protein